MILIPKTIDFIKSFIFIIKLILYKYLFKIYLKQKYKIQQIDLVIVFLFEFLNDIIYIEKSSKMINLKLIIYPTIDGVLNINKEVVILYIFT